MHSPLESGSLLPGMGEIGSQQHHIPIGEIIGVVSYNTCPKAFFNIEQFAGIMKMEWNVQKGVFPCFHPWTARTMQAVIKRLCGHTDILLNVQQGTNVWHWSDPGKYNERSRLRIHEVTFPSKLVNMSQMEKPRFLEDYSAIYGRF